MLKARAFEADMLNAARICARSGAQRALSYDIHFRVC